jgi:hypothetical protein
MGRYHGRHSARHAVPSGRHAFPRHEKSSSAPARLWASKPAALSMAIVAATTTTAMAADSSVQPETVTMTLSSNAVSQSAEVSSVLAQDAARLAGERAGMNASRAEVRAKIEAQTTARAEAEALARKQEADRVARERAEQQEAEKKAAALELQAAQANPQLAAQYLMPEYGFGPDQWGCLATLWMGESDWRWWVENPSSGAYGIPQSLPADKMAEEGPDWKTNPVTQIRWGLNYIKLSYGTPCNALDFWNAQNPHWY